MRFWTLLAAALLVGCAGCGGGDDGHAAESAAFATEAVNVLDSMDEESAIMATLVDDVNVAGTPAEAASFAAARALTAWTPAGCVTATADANDAARVVFVLTGCAGPFSLADVSGTLDVSYGRAADGGISIAVLSEDLAVAGRSYHGLTVAGSYLPTGSQRRLTAHSTATALGPGEAAPFERGGDYVTGWDEGAACRSLEGTWDSMAGGAPSWTSAATGFVRCAGGCPQGGAALTFTEAPPGTGHVSLSFGGGASATWMTADGTKGTIPLPCGN
jgi:hypothetical protein